MSAFKTDGTFTNSGATAGTDGSWRKSFPIPGDNTSFVLEQDVMCLFANFTPLALNTPHGTFTDAYLVSESPLEDLGGGVAKWTRTYAQVPQPRNEFETFAFRFPGYYGSADPPYSQYWVAFGDGRDPFSEPPVQSRLYHEYFLCAPGETYETPEEIPVITAQTFTLVGNDQARIDYLLPEGVFWSDSLPSKEDYQDMVTAGDDLVAENSRVERYLGNIYVRITRYVKAK